MITEKQYNELVERIYQLLMQQPDMGMGEMGDCKKAATQVVSEWTVTSGVTIDSERLSDDETPYTEYDYNQR